MAKRLLQFIIILSPAFLFAWLLYLDINPSGTFEVSYTMGDISPYVDKLLPAERVSSLQKSTDGHFVTIVDEPVYFSAHAPQTSYEEVEVELVFASRGQSFVEFGPRVDLFSQSYDLQPAYNQTIEDSSWYTLSAGDNILLQREQDFVSMDAFLADPPATDRIATYTYDFDEPYRLKDYSVLGRQRNIDVSLRGFHKYLTYIKDESLDLTVTFMDMNRTVGADDVVLRVINEAGDIVFEESHGDDLNKTDNQISSTRSATIHLPRLNEGVYTVELSGTSDIFWRRLESPQRYMSFVNQLYIGDDVGHTVEPRSTTFFTNAKEFALETFHAESTQRLNIGREEIAIPRSHEKIHVSLTESGVLGGTTLEGDIKIVGDGKFAFSRDAFFDPEPVKLSAGTDLDLRNVDYILTTYEKPFVDTEGWSHTVANFKLADIVDEDGSMTFTISTPSIVIEQGSVDVHKVILRFKKDRLSSRTFWTALRERLPFGL